MTEIDQIERWKRNAADSDAQAKYEIGFYSTRLEHEIDAHTAYANEVRARNRRDGEYLRLALEHQRAVTRGIEALDAKNKALEEAVADRDKHSANLKDAMAAAWARNKSVRADLERVVAGRLAEGARAREAEAELAKEKARGERLFAWAEKHKTKRSMERARADKAEKRTEVQAVIIETLRADLVEALRKNEELSAERRAALDLARDRADKIVDLMNTRAEEVVDLRAEVARLEREYKAVHQIKTELLGEKYAALKHARLQSIEIGAIEARLEHTNRRAADVEARAKAEMEASHERRNKSHAEIAELRAQLAELRGELEDADRRAAKAEAELHSHTLDDDQIEIAELRKERELARGQIQTLRAIGLEKGQEIEHLRAELEEAEKHAKITSGAFRREADERRRLRRRIEDHDRVVYAERAKADAANARATRAEDALRAREEERDTAIEHLRAELAAQEENNLALKATIDSMCVVSMKLNEPEPTPEEWEKIMEAAERVPSSALDGYTVDVNYEFYTHPAGAEFPIRYTMWWSPTDRCWFVDGEGVDGGPPIQEEATRKPDGSWFIGERHQPKHDKKDGHDYALIVEHLNTYGAPYEPEGDPAPTVMPLVVVESPYAWNAVRHTDYTRACLADSLRRGEAPYASHALYTLPGVLDEAKPEERRKGIEAGFAWGARAAVRVVYCDHGITPGMREGIEEAKRLGQRIEYRRILEQHEVDARLVEPTPKTLTKEEAEAHCALLEEMKVKDFENAAAAFGRWMDGGSINT